MDFKRQIDEDLDFIQNEYVHLDKLLKKKDYAFNYWILMKLFSIDEELVNDLITEYRDDGIDSYVFYEDSKELYIIQNKYYTTTPLKYDYVQKEFLLKPLDTLVSNNYKRSKELQKIFNKYKDDSEFQISFHLYVSNNDKNIKVKDKFKDFNRQVDSKYDIKARVTSRLFYLDDIEEHYFGGRKKERKNFSFDFVTPNKGTVLNIDNKNYDLPNLITAKYVLTPVKQLYEILKKSKEIEYPLFSANIREYLGKKGINKKIAETLEDPNDRNNFFYYNNGITVICEKLSKKTESRGEYHNVISTYNPQIVNGAQTVNTIFDVLDNYNPKDIEEEFKSAFVMVKLLELDDKNQGNKQLYEDIVRYNNSQNRIDEKYFEAVNQKYLNIQTDFEEKGFILLVKQSDKEKFRNKYKNNVDLMLAKADNFANDFGVKMKSYSDLTIQLDKLLQVLLAFTKNGYEAYAKKNRVLKPDDEISNHVHNYLKNNKITREELLLLYLFYKRAEQDKKESPDGRTPIPYYVIGFFGNDIENKNLDAGSLLKRFKNNKNLIEPIYTFYNKITRKYAHKIINDKFDYQKMIKSKINSDILVEAKDDVINDMKYDNPEMLEVYKKFMSR